MPVTADEPRPILSTSELISPARPTGGCGSRCGRTGPPFHSIPAVPIGAGRASTVGPRFPAACIQEGRYQARKKKKGQKRQMPEKACREGPTILDRQRQIAFIGLTDFLEPLLRSIAGTLPGGFFGMMASACVVTARTPSWSRFVAIAAPGDNLRVWEQGFAPPVTRRTDQREYHCSDHGRKKADTPGRYKDTKAMQMQGSETKAGITICCAPIRGGLGNRFSFFQVPVDIFDRDGGVIRENFHLDRQSA